jgi:hypothetical protein
MNLDAREGREWPPHLRLLFCTHGTTLATWQPRGHGLPDWCRFGFCHAALHTFLFAKVTQQCAIPVLPFFHAFRFGMCWVRRCAHLGGATRRRRSNLGVAARTAWPKMEESHGPSYAMGAAGQVLAPEQDFPLRWTSWAVQPATAISAEGSERREIAWTPPRLSHLWVRQGVSRLVCHSSLATCRKGVL